MKNGKIRYTIDLDADLALKADAFFESMGATRKSGVERMLSWIIDQDELLQGIVLGNVPEKLKPYALKLLLQEIASDEPGIDLSNKGVDLSDKGIAGKLGDHEIHMDQAARDFGDEEEQTGTK